MPGFGDRSSRRGLIRSDLRTIVGAVALLLTMAIVLTSPPGPIGVLTGAVATIALAADRRLGPLPAALLVALAVPWGRGADTLTWDVAGLPVRPHDAILAIGILGALPVLVRRRPRTTPTLVLLVAMLIMGIGALGLGLLADYPLRDVFRDVRWWFLYGAAILALFGATTRPKILRGLLIGMSLFSALVIVATLLPVMPGGLKDQALVYDHGTLRLQFSNSAFLLPAIAFVASAVLDRRHWTDTVWLILLATALVLSLTRTSLAASAVGVGLVFVADVVALWRAGAPLGGHARGIARLALAGVLALALGVTFDVVGTPAPGQVAASGGRAGEQPLARIFFQEQRSSIESLDVGRFPSYRAAAGQILVAPVTGRGLGSLTPVGYAYNAARAHTIGWSPGVDNAYLTVGLKAGVPGMVLFAMLVVATFIVAFKRGGRMGRWFLPAWAGMIVLTMTQAFAGSLYGPFAFGLLIALPVLQVGASVPRAVRRPAGA